MFKVLFFIACATLVVSQDVVVRPRVDYLDDSAPTPYRFSYTAPAIGGSSSHEESGDGQGRVTGSYSVEDEDGRQRIVDYVADEGGFRASISTNEPGTANQNPADVTIASSADDGYGGTQSLQVVPVAPPAPVVPVAVAPRPAPPPPPLPARRQILVPAQPSLVPIQPALIPLQPTFIPVQSEFITPRRFAVSPQFFPLDAGRLVPRPNFFDSRRFINAPPALIPIQGPRVIPDPSFRPFDWDILA